MKKKDTVVADLEFEGGMLEGIQSTFHSEWQQRDEEERRQESQVIEELVAMNIELNTELGRC